MTPREALESAVQKAGGQSALARAVGAKRHQNVQQWLKCGKTPAKWCVAVERATGISRSVLRPDVFVEYAGTSTDSNTTNA